LQAIDAAKKNAVKQRADVETFESLVSAAQLRPMRGGLRLAAIQGSKPKAAALSFGPDGTLETLCTASSSSRSSENIKKAAVDNALRSGSHFGRAWRATSCVAKRRHLLQQAHAAGALPRLLKLELNSRMLQDFVDLLEIEEPAASEASPDACSMAAGVLKAAAAAKCFAVALAGLSLQARQRLDNLAHALKISWAASSRMVREACVVEGSQPEDPKQGS
jgi:hypothetical protein